ncbi:type II toxin-antitoxin system prevent-host-death family antitoxin [uncultured Sphingomonas sp.]|uniref:type II toxin-antitoxin system prevent-host-death family antitoxin n=1 Tax=uncultured Sphingomonas sp. TaxID=158754 RepID=UPI0035CCA556
MKMSVREVRANFAAAVDAAAKGEHVTITKNGQVVAELGPPKMPKGTGFDWERNEQVRQELGLDKYDGPPLDEKWLEEFNDPKWAREIFGPNYFDDEPDAR